VRNALMALSVSDIDIATTLEPGEVMRRMAAAGLKTVPTGVEHGTVTVVHARRGYEVTTLRRDVETDGRRAVVAFTRDFAEDALRRDFTINQLSLDAEGGLHDHADGLTDLAARRVRFIGEAEQRIREDYLRILRFFRFSAQYGHGVLDPVGLAACAALAGGMVQLSRERIWSEVKKLLVAPRAGEALASAMDCGIWGRIVLGAADLAAFNAAVTLRPEADAMTRLAALSLRMAGDPDALDGAFRLSATERRRLEAALAARDLLLKSGSFSAQACREAAFRHGAEGARDGLLTFSERLNARDARGWLALPAPVSPFKGADVVALGLPAGPKVGAVLAEAERLWIASGFESGRKAEYLKAAVDQVG
jgi:poly(A) polymerase